MTVDALIDEIAENPQDRQLMLPKPEEWQIKGVTLTHHAFSPIPVKINIDRMDLRFEATFINDAFPPEFVLVIKN